MSVLFSFLFHMSYFVSLHIFSEEHLLSSLYLEITPLVLGFSGGIVVKNPSAVQEWIPHQGWEDLPEKEMATHSSILAGKFQGQRSLRKLPALNAKYVNFIFYQFFRLDTQSFALLVCI